MCVLWNIKKHNLECFTDELAVKQSYVTKMNIHTSVWQPECQEDCRNGYWTKYNDCNTNLSLLTEKNGVGERIQ